MTQLCLKHFSNVGIHKLALNSGEADGSKMIYLIDHGRSTCPNIVGLQKHKTVVVLDQLGDHDAFRGLGGGSNV